MEETPRFINGVYSFSGTGLGQASLLDASLTYAVPFNKRAQLIYFRAGNSSSELIDVCLMRDGKPMRHFPIGAKAATHVPLAVVEDLEPDTKIEVFLAAPSGTVGTVILDIGLIEI